MSESQISADEARLNSLGYKQELLRSLGGFSNFAVSFSVISILTGSITLYGYGLSTAGPFGIIFGWIIVSIASCFIALAMAELASAYPTAGALNDWATFLGNKCLGWFTALFNYFGQFAITAGIDFGLAEFLVNLIGIEGQTNKFLVYAAILLSHAFINHFGIRWVALFNDISAWYHVFGSLILMGIIYFIAPLRDSKFLLETFSSSSYPYGYAFCLGLLQAQWTIAGYDASAHVSEETVRVSERVPLAIILSVVSSSILGFILLVVITLAIQDVSLVLKASNPFISIMQTALGTKLGNSMVWLCVIAMWFCGLSSLTSNSRMLYAFARDRGVPFYERLAFVCPKHKTPIFAIWVSVVLAFLVVLYGKVFEVIVSISTVLILISYLIPILVAFRRQREGQWLNKGSFQLGKWSLFCQGAASLWILFVIGVFVMPPNTLTFYSVLGVLIFAIALYFLHHRRVVSMLNPHQKLNSLELE